MLRHHSIDKKKDRIKMYGVYMEEYEEYDK